MQTDKETNKIYKVFEIILAVGSSPFSQLGEDA